MNRNFKKRWYLFIPLGIAGLIAFGFAAMYLWNWLMPALFHLPEITFWQTVGLMILSRMILGFGCHGRRHHDHYHSKMHDKWAKMTPEEREQFREHLRLHQSPWSRCYTKKEEEKE